MTKSYSNKSFKHFRDYVLLHLLIDGMFRITEVLLLSPSDIDHANQVVIIQSNNVKSRKSRIVPLSNKTYRLLMQLFEENSQLKNECQTVNKRSKSMIPPLLMILLNLLPEVFLLIL
ncbi:tyrosine-type recombinase/integrase [Bacillus pacificus]|uniref:tyrosine-type recombinase/integrase n=1 Tax=Bacillus TaxID=1386 RepID=UPI001E624291|nr:tyrosine-type recombinase/integrase [Bacillus pacificus]MCU5008825.1 tyrosine-type recombinase/integrase [Bacillus pacificus]MCU5259505.1 tyrosine-type recombinase/integrase [Bacillus pacificus]MCU5562043.1 tyrosine-type recombinase/integrase [Bacillus pacificus]